MLCPFYTSAELGGSSTRDYICTFTLCFVLSAPLSSAECQPLTVLNMMFIEPLTPMLRLASTVDNATLCCSAIPAFTAPGMLGRQLHNGPIQRMRTPCLLCQGRGLDLIAAA